MNGGLNQPSLYGYNSFFFATTHFVLIPPTFDTQSVNHMRLLQTVYPIQENYIGFMNMSFYMFLYVTFLNLKSFSDVKLNLRS